MRMGKHFRSPSQATTTSYASFSDLSKRERFKQNTKKNWHSFKKYVYNKDHKTFCNKNCKHWWLLIFFYLVFMVILFGIVCGVIVLIMYYMQRTRTEALFDKSLLVKGSAPALGIIPRLKCDPTTLVWYTHKRHPSNVKQFTVDTYTRAIDNFLRPYENLNGTTYIDCDKKKPKNGQYCKFTKEDLGPCGRDGYGYKDDKPCVYLKINKYKGWIPKYNDEAAKKIPIFCDGITAFDVDHMGNVSYYPGPYFKDYFFPYDGSPLYKPPLVGIRFEMLNHGFVIGMKCTVDRNVVNMQNEVLHTAIAFIYIDI